MVKIKIPFIVLLLLILISIPSFASSEFVCVFTLTNPSATNVAFGNESGTANIWDRNPLGVWSNPAKLGYYKGLAYGYLHDKWFDDLNLDIYHNSSYLTFGWNGIGILVPFINNSKKFGTTLDYGEQIVVDPNGYQIYTFKQYETCSQFAFGINCLEFADNFFESNQTIYNFQKYFEISLGYSLNYIKSSLPYIMNDSLLYTEGKEHSQNIGVLIKITPLNINNENIKIDITSGINIINIFKSNISFKYDNGDEYKWSMPYGNRAGIAGKISYINLKNLPDEYPLLSSISNYLFSIYASYDNAKYGDDNSIWGKGVEFTFLDIFSLRYGKYYDYKGHIVGDCEGWGINLNYRDILGFQYNYVEYIGELQKTKKKKIYHFVLI